MKVLIASDTYYPHVNGASYFTQRLAQALAEAGHEVAVVSPGPEYVSTTAPRGKVTHYGVRSFPFIFVPRFRFVVPIISGISGTVRRAIREFKPDIVHIQMHFPISRTALREAQRRGIPVVATNHFMPDNLTHYLHLPESVTRAINQAMWWDAARVLEKAQGISAPTQTSVDIMQPQLSKKMLAISNGIDLKRFNPTNDPTPARTRYNLPAKPILLFVGRLDKEKNVDIVLRAVAKARATTDFHFVAAGHGAEETNLKKLAAQLGLADHVTFTGFVPDDLLPSLYAAGDCFVNAGTAELQCIVAMEAMATGLPILGARAVALPELIHSGQNGYLFEPYHVEELAGRLAEVMSSADLRARMGHKSLEIIAHHDLTTILERFEDFYRAAMNA
jgi:1,2-diacylglycerol 3-alpha-glucosyltransferase